MTKLNKFLWMAALLVLISPLAKGSTTVSSMITGNQVWTAANSPYIVSGNVLVDNGATVKVMPGVTVQSTGNYTVIVEGEFIAEGTYDSIIVMDKVDFSFSKGAIGYDFVNDVGSNFTYCLFNGNQLGYRTIILNDVSLLISNCKFMNCYYTVYAMNYGKDSSKVMMVQCIFDNNNSNLGYPVNMTGQNSFFEMDRCLVLKMAGVFLPNHTKITRSTFLNCPNNGGIRIPRAVMYNPGECIIKCNIFKNFKYAVIEMSIIDTFMDIDIEDNTFDSCDVFIDFRYSPYGSCRPIIKNNNFLYSKTYAIKFSGGSVGVPDVFDLSSNYWGTTDTVKIAAKIFDFKDDITVSPKGNTSGYLSNPVSSCSEPAVSIRVVEKTVFSIYPNPAVGNFTLTLSQEGQKFIRIYNMMGALVFSGETGENEISVNGSELSNGLYTVEVISEGKQSGTQKLIINK